MARTFVRLKLRLLRNGLRMVQARVLFILGALGAAWIAIIGFSTLAAARGDTAGPDLAVVIFAVATLGWTVFPILGFGNDETLDPQRLATLPLSRRQLVTGVLTASLVGVARGRGSPRDVDRIQRSTRRLRPRPRVDAVDRRGHPREPAVVRCRVTHTRCRVGADPALPSRS